MLDPRLPRYKGRILFEEHDFRTQNSMPYLPSLIKKLQICKIYCKSKYLNQKLVRDTINQTQIGKYQVIKSYPPPTISLEKRN